MKRRWTVAELTEHWTLLPEERILIDHSKGNHNRLDFAILLKYFQYHGRFPHHDQEISADVIAHMAQQLGAPVECYQAYNWKRRSIKLKARQTRHHSPATAAKPRKENCRNPRISLMIPIMGSTVHLRNR